MWTTIKYILMTAIIFFVLFVIFAFVLNIIKPVYHYFGRQLPVYMDRESTGLVFDFNDKSIDHTFDLPNTWSIIWWDSLIITGDAPPSNFQAYYQAILNTGIGETIIHKQFEKESDYIDFLNTQNHNPEISLWIKMTGDINDLSTSGWQIQDPLLDISLRESKRSDLLIDQYNQHIYRQTIQRLQFLRNFFVEHGMMSEVSEIDRRIEQLTNKI